MNKPIAYPFKAMINGHRIKQVLIGRHYLLKHGHYMTDQIILELVSRLDHGTFPVDSASDGIEYYAADIEFGKPVKIYRLIWLFEGDAMEILGVVHAYRRKKGKKQ